MKSLASVKSEDEALQLAQELGRMEAEAFDQQLRQQEERDREIRLGELAWERVESQSERRCSHDVARLEARIDEQSYYLQAIERSFGWRVIQWLRGLVGRAW